MVRCTRYIETSDIGQGHQYPGTLGGIQKAAAEGCTFVKNIVVVRMMMMVMLMKMDVDCDLYFYQYLLKFLDQHHNGSLMMAPRLEDDTEDLGPRCLCEYEARSGLKG